MFKKIVKKLIPEKYHYDLRLLRFYLQGDDFYYELVYRREFMRNAFHLLSFNGITGDYAEFGCCSGNTFNLAYKESRKFNFNCKLWAFDSFSGLPSASSYKDEHPIWREGSMYTSIEEFHIICRNNKIPDSTYSIIPGFYKDTIGSKESPNSILPIDIALAYIDCDMYSSTKIVLEFLIKRLKHGMIIAFDDYYCFSNTAISGERRAYLEFININKDHRFNLLPYLQFGWHGMSFIVEDKSFAPELYSDHYANK